MLDVSPLEGGARGAGGGEEPLTVPQHQLAVGADVHDEGHLLLVVGLLGDEHPHIVGPHEAGLNGEEVDVGPRRHPQPQLPRLDVQGSAQRRRERGNA